MATMRLGFQVVCFALLAAVSASAPDQEPVYNYHYQTAESMKTSASGTPYHGYRVYEGDYYPDAGYYPSSGYYSGYQGGRYTDAPWNGGYYPGYYPHYSGSSGIYHRPSFYPSSGGIQGGFLDKKVYLDENKNEKGESFEKAQGSKGESGKHGSEGFSQGQVAVKDVKGDSGYYNDQEGDKKSFSDGKTYQGGQHYSEAGGKGHGDSGKQNHKKGHVKKGFKTSHHKDESGSTETFYDEAHDEGGKFHYDSNEGSFGAKGASSYQGGHEDGRYAADERAKQGHYDRHHLTDNSKAAKGEFGNKGYHGSSEAYNQDNGAGHQSLLGKQEANRLFINHHPHGYVPFYPGDK